MGRNLIGMKAVSKTQGKCFGKETGRIYAAVSKLRLAIK